MGVLVMMVFMMIILIVKNVVINVLHVEVQELFVVHVMEVLQGQQHLLVLVLPIILMYNNFNVKNVHIGAKNVREIKILV